MEMAEEYGLNRMRQDDDDDDEGNAIAPPTPAPPVAVPEEINEDEAPMEMVPEQDTPVVHEVILLMQRLSHCSPASST
jgi:hypothetical protein